MAPYALREALSASQRTPLLTLLSIVAISLSLFVVGLFGLTAYNISRAIDEIEERVEVVAYLRDGTTDEQLTVARAEITALPEVQQLLYVSKTEALATAMDEFDEFRDAFADLDVNPLPASLELRLNDGFRDPESVELLAQRLLAYPFVEDVSFGRPWIEKIVSLRRISAGAAGVLGISFGIVAAIIIASAIRIAVFARREEISIMRLVGATDGFIRRPFLLEGFIAGLVGGALAVALTFVTFRVVDATLISISWLPIEWTLLGVAAGAIFGLLSSAVAVRRHLGAI
ncbi:MAG TPA: permease-like cell division protein FtsX [Longimicrobiaceae bacterium]|nr:permease-like cell division protein FtsX [Longimicrobiaceae bacterium]